VSRYDAVLLDAFGTLIGLDDPFGRLRTAARSQLGVEVAQEDAERAMLAEVAYYEVHCHEASDAESLHALRLTCAGIVRDELGLEITEERALSALAEAIVFHVYDDVAPTLAGLGDANVSTAVVSNWDCSLPDTLQRVGIEIPVVVDSATSGTAKPDPAIFRRALDLLGVAADRALHVGDLHATDGEGARAAGVDVRILDRSGVAGAGTIASLTEILQLVR
jgi:putative hydrolase of the HAD superfamily